MFDYRGFVTEQLARLRREQRYRRFRVLDREPGSFPLAEWIRPDGSRRDVVVWCSNDYLGMSQHPAVLEAAAAALARFGTGAGGTRNISGTHALIVELETELAALQSRQAALVFSSGYVANDTALATLGRHLPGCTFYSDAHNHASMIEGMRRSGAPCAVFAHNDASDLRRLLAAGDPSLPRVVAFESLYSMDGDTAPIAELVQVARSHGALVYIDETHAVGVHGPGGAGLVAESGLLGAVNFIQGGLGKGYGAVGGFITGSTNWMDFLRSYGSGFIFTTALPPTVAAAALASVRHLRRSDSERSLLSQRVAQTRAALTQRGLPLLPGSTQILPLIVGDGGHCDALADRLIERQGIYLQPINYPTVPRGTERFRITPTARHAEMQVEALAKALSTESDWLTSLRAA